MTFLDRWVFSWLLVFLAGSTFSTALMEISCVAALAGWSVLRVWKGGPFLFERKTFLALSAFVFLNCISIFWSEFPRQSLQGIFKVLKQFFLFWMTAETLRPLRRQRFVFHTLVAILIFLGLNGIWQYIFGADLVRRIPFEAASSGPRISASFHNYGLLACFVISFLPVLLSRWDRNENPKLFLPTALGILLGGLLLFWTRLRGAWVAWLGGLVFLLWVEKRKLYLSLLVLLTLFSLFVLPRWMAIHLDSQGKEQSLVERFYLWDRALQVIAARPWTGTGINTYAVAHQKYDRRQNWRVKNYYAHNGYLQIAAETGLPSLACFLAFLLFYFKEAFVFLERHSAGIQRRTLVGILAGVVNFLILGLIDTILHNPPSIMAFWFLLGWGVACQKQTLTSSPQRSLG